MAACPAVLGMEVTLMALSSTAALSAPFVLQVAGCSMEKSCGRTIAFGLLRMCSQLRAHYVALLDIRGA